MAVTKAKKHSQTSSYQILKRNYKATFLSLDCYQQAYAEPPKKANHQYYTKPLPVKCKTVKVHPNQIVALKLNSLHHHRQKDTNQFSERIFPPSLIFQFLP